MASDRVHVVAALALIWLCCCSTALAERTTLSTSQDTGNNSEWWTEDHPYMYRYRYKRFPNGSIALKKAGDDENDKQVTLKEWKENTTADVTPFERFFYQKGTRSAMKDVTRHVLMNLVPPCGYGSALKRARVAKLQSKMAKSYMLHTIAIPGVKLLGRLIVDAVKLHYGGYIERQVAFKRMQTMSLEQIYAELNVTPPVWDPEADFEANRPNFTMPYEWKGLPRTFQHITIDGEQDAGAFAPYANYTRMYYSRDDDLPAPVLPAESYPWLWWRQLAETRDMILQVMALNVEAYEAEMAQLEEDGEMEDESFSAAAGAQSGSNGEASSLAAESVLRRLQEVGSGSELLSSSSSSAADGNDADAEGDDDDEAESGFEAAEEFEEIVAEYHFSTGIPRILQQNYSYFPFPKLESLLNASSTTNSESANADDGSSSASSVSLDGSSSNSPRVLSSSLSGDTVDSTAIVDNSTSALDGSAVDNFVNRSANASTGLLDPFNATQLASTSSLLRWNQQQERKREVKRKRKRVLHDAMLQFYAYPTVDSSMVMLPKPGWKRVPDYELAGVNCSVEMPCLVQSSVTVYTPQLSSLGFFQKVVRNPTISKEQQRQVRVKVLQSMVDVAFQAEQKALEHGLQAPSTAWYSLFDRNVDEFADAIQSHVNSTWDGGSGVDDGDGTAVSALDVYTSLVENKSRSLFHTLPSYYWSTLRDSKRGMEITKVVPALEPLSEAEQIELISYIAAKMKELDGAIAAFVAKRNANEEYQQVVNATTSKAEYEGNQYSTLGFGFLLPATNRLNVLYRELKLPVPFHLTLRLFVRFQESRLLLQDESLHMVTCLAMLRSEIPYYRCRHA